MRSLVLAAVGVGAVCSALACRQIAGIDPVTYGPSDGGGDGDGGGCANGTPLLMTGMYDDLAVENGFVYVDVLQAGLYRCATSGCTTAMSLISGSAGTYEAFALGSSLAYYVAQGGSNDAGTASGAVHSIGLDGTNDTVVAPNLPNPYWVAVSGSRIFWVDDPVPSAGTGLGSVNCIGCSGMGSTPWIPNLMTQTYGLIADANDVYVVVDSGNAMGAITGLALACSTQTACTGATTPRQLPGQVFISTSTGSNALSYAAPSIASDGTNAYVVRSADIVRVGPTGTIATLAAGVSSGAVAFDSSTGDVYYSVDNTSTTSTTSTIYRAHGDGSGATPIVCANDAVTALAVDSQNVYFLPVSGGVLSAPK